jgi:hypothetical protein
MEITIDTIAGQIQLVSDCLSTVTILHQHQTKFVRFSPDEPLLAICKDIVLHLKNVFKIQLQPEELCDMVESVKLLQTYLCQPKQFNSDIVKRLMSLW